MKVMLTPSRKRVRCSACSQAVCGKRGRAPATFLHEALDVLGDPLGFERCTGTEGEEGVGAVADALIVGEVWVPSELGKEFRKTPLGVFVIR